jgi:hypothetical protein
VNRQGGCKLTSLLTNGPEIVEGCRGVRVPAADMLLFESDRALRELDRISLG